MTLSRLARIICFTIFPQAKTKQNDQLRDNPNHEARYSHYHFVSLCIDRSLVPSDICSQCAWFTAGTVDANNLGMKIVGQ